MMVPSFLRSAISLVVALQLLTVSVVNGLSVLPSLAHPSKTKETRPSATLADTGGSTEHTRRAALAATASSSLLLLVPPPVPFVTRLSPAARAAEDTISRDDYQDGPEGIRYKVIDPGFPTGKKPERAQPVQTLYTLYINGFPDEVSNSKQIDSTKKFYGEQPFPVRAGVRQVIRGWDLSLLDMVEGEARRLIIPSSLGYGDKGMGPIPGKATLYFEVKLIKVEKMQELTPEAKNWLMENPL